MPLFSIYALLIYFGILREENDIDLMLEKGPVYDGLCLFESLGKRELQKCLKEYARHGLDGENIIHGLSELELEGRRVEIEKNSC